MAKEVIMPALGMAQETGTLLQWLKAAGETVAKGEPLMEIETDKATVEIEAPASGVLTEVTAQPGDVVPVGRRIALIRAADEPAPASPAPQPSPAQAAPAAKTEGISASPLATRMAAEQHIDLADIKPAGGRIQKEDVLAYLTTRSSSRQPAEPQGRGLASPKARRLAREHGLEIRAISGSGPQGAVLAADVLARVASEASPRTTPSEPPMGSEQTPAPQAEPETQTQEVGRLWRIMAERVTQAWTTIPQFYLIREVNASRLVAWHQDAQKRISVKISYTDLLVKIVAAALRQHPRLNASWQEGAILLHPEVNIGLAVAVEDGLVVPVIQHADQLGVGQLAARRAELIVKAQANKLSPADLRGGTFTISNLGMHGVDAFTAIVNPPQAAILAVGRIADRVVPLHGQPAIQPMLALSLSCDHRVADGARAAQFFQTLVALLEDPLSALD